MISTCIVSGTILNLENTPITNVTVRARLITPFFHTDGTWVPDYEVSTNTDENGEWELTLIETETVERTILMSIEYPNGSTGNLKKEFSVTIPNEATANFADLVEEE